MSESIENAQASDDLDAVVRAVVDDLAEEVGQSIPVKTVVTDDVRKTSGLAAYHVETDTLYLDSALAHQLTEDPGSYFGTGVILHELGHRSDRQLMLWRFRAFWWPIYASMLPMLALLVIGTWTNRPWVWATMAAMVAVWVVIVLFFCVPLAWYSEFRADDYCCDVGGIARAAAVLSGLCDIRLPWGRALAAGLTHPPSGMRFRRQIRRAGY